MVFLCLIIRQIETLIQKFFNKPFDNQNKFHTFVKTTKRIRR
jgi:hypothetical protein